MHNKYNNKKVMLDGYKFDSKKEARRYQELKLLQVAGKIRDLELQPVFLLQEGFIKHLKRIRAITYVADFKYIDTESNKVIVEDVKGVKTDVFKIKYKLFLKRYDFELKIIE